eukprot:scaffold48_cov311-Pinguiococcus_pyrenoidosus.AAC.185
MRTTPGDKRNQDSPRSTVHVASRAFVHDEKHMLCRASPEDEEAFPQVVLEIANRHREVGDGRDYPRGQIHVLQLPVPNEDNLLVIDPHGVVVRRLAAAHGSELLRRGLVAQVHEEEPRRVS